MSPKPKVKPAAPTSTALDYTVSTPDGASWPEGSRYMVWRLPTQPHSRGGLSFSPSKRAARVRQHS
jgi:hypothetical protein